MQLELGDIDEKKILYLDSPRGVFVSRAATGRSDLTLRYESQTLGQGPLHSVKKVSSVTKHNQEKRKSSRSTQHQYLWPPCSEKPSASARRAAMFADPTALYFPLETDLLVIWKLVFPYEPMHSTMFFFLFLPFLLVPRREGNGGGRVVKRKREKERSICLKKEREGKEGGKRGEGRKEKRSICF